MKSNPQPPGASFSFRSFSGVPVIDISGRLTLGQSAEGLLAAVRSVLSHDVRVIILNLEAVEYIDSAGIGELVGCQRFVSANGTSLKLVRVPQRVHDLLSLTGVFTQFDIRPDEASALANTSSGAA